MPSITRRGFHRLVLSALPAAGVLAAMDPLRAAESRPDSRVAGVQIGLNVPYSFANMAMTADQVCAELVRVHTEAVADFKARNPDPEATPPGWDPSKLRGFDVEVEPAQVRQP